MNPKIIEEIHLTIQNALNKQLRDIAKQYPDVIGYRPDESIIEQATARINFLAGLEVSNRWKEICGKVDNCINEQKNVSLKHGKDNQ